MPTKRNTPSPPPLPLNSKPQLPAQPLAPVQSLSCMRCYDFSAVDEHASRFPRHTVSSLQSLAYDLTEPFDTETEKARALFTWLHHNITYDVDAFLSGNLQPSTPESTLSSGLAVCDGYAGLFKYLAECVGMQVHKITGHGKGVGYKALEPGEPLPPMKMNHAWNCILTDGVWRLVDPCWGAGALNITMYVKRFDASWFTSTPAEFGRRHFPEDPSYQLIADEDGGPISWEQYMDEPEPGPIIFAQFYEAKLDPATVQPASKFIRGGQYVHFSVFKLCEHMSTADEDNFVYFVMMENSRTPLYLNNEGGWSADVFIPAGAEVALYFVTTVNGQDAKGLGAHGFNAVNGRSAMQFGGLLKWSPA
ncbi:hypothetical protein BDQ12DRAFT_641641 [Crucibulum laeve]|uniref:Transglutaminase-like domain-containing protein n=1 Tax=Crucibulum laeve TaxID=68775 RepID=A0A5C3MH85_9AGAR|nr:hypothetical protein BDQ12DRAFT_641641 [Crucibulum laeve]